MLLLFSFLAGADAGGYSNVLTQHQKNDAPPSQTLLRTWLLNEINNDSLMRSEIKDFISEIENNGHNDNFLVHYCSPGGLYLGRLVFKSSDIALHVVTVKDRPGIYNYRAVVTTHDYGHRVDNIVTLTFVFQIHVEYFKYTNAYMVTATSYPKFISNDVKSKSW